MKNLIYSILISILYLYNISPVYGQKNTWQSIYSMEYINTKNGLPNDYIDYIFKDSRGFIWFATNGSGIVRYDSYNFKSVNLQQTSNEFRNNYARKICEDKFGRLWVIGQDGIDITDTKSLKCVSPYKDKNLSDLIKNIIATDILCSSTGNIWISTNKNLIKVDFNKNGEINHINKIIEFNIPSANVSIAEHSGFIYFNQNNALYRIKEITEEQDKHKDIKLIINNLQDVNTIKSFNDELWIATNYGMIIYNITNNKMEKIVHIPDNPNSLSQSQITDIAFIDSSNILISTLKGLNIYNRNNKKVERIVQNDKGTDNDDRGLNCNFINCLLYDKDVIWIGTEAGGINKMTAKRLQVRNLLNDKNNSGNVINCIAEDSQKRLWVGAVEGGLYLFENIHTPPVHYTKSAPAFLPHLSVSCLTPDNRNRLWVGTWGGGFGWINTGKNTIPLFHQIDFESDKYDLYHIRGMCYDKNNNMLWLGSNKDVYAYDITGNKITAPLKDKNLGGIKAENAGCIIDKNNYLWLGLSKGLCRVNLNKIHQKDIEYELWSFKLDNPDSGIKEHVSYIFESKNGDIWIGSNGFGLYKVIKQDKENIRFKRFDLSDGLINNCVRGITEDNNGNLWITTTQGISCFNPQTQTFTNFVEKDGLTGNQFYWNSICKGINGEIYAGSMSGLSVIYPSTHKKKPSDAPIVITELQVANRDITGYDDEIIMNESDKTITIEFAALNYSSPLQIFYAYRIKELSDKWQETNPDNRKVTFTNLKAGTYTFEAIYSTDHKNWTSAPLRITFRVIPPFYKRGWFIFTVIVTFLGILLFNHFQRIRRLKEQRDILENEVQLRTKELTKRNEQLSSQNSIITKQKEEILNASTRIQELTSDKLSFFTNIAHEFRTPLTLITGPVNRALQLTKDNDVIQQLKYVERNSQYMLSLVNQLLDFRKMEAGKIEIQNRPCHIESFINNIIYPLSAYASDKSITLNIMTHFNKHNIMTDENAIQKIVTNIISNALKFTPSGGVIKIYAAIITDSSSKRNRLFISVCDNGTGIKPEHLNYVFDMFYQSKHDNSTYMNASGGTGIGLALCKQLTRMLNGKISVKNNRKKGCTFRVMLPIEIAREYAESISDRQDINNLEPTYIKDSATKKEDSILIVDDNTDMRGYIRSILNSEFNIYEASNGKEALCMLQEQHVDMIISDLMMPEMDGATLSKNVKSNLSISHIPFIILTAKASEESRIESYKTGVDDYLTKPFNEEVLLARVRNILENRKQTKLMFSYNMDTSVLQIEETSKDNLFIESVMTFIKNNYSNPEFEINDIIKHVGISRSLFYQKLQDLTGESAGQIIRNYRLNTARELIIKKHFKKDINISEIAYQVGFNDPKYFSRCFTKRFNITPSALMKE